MKSKKYEDSDKQDKLVNKALEGAAAERVSRFGSAAKEHFVAFSRKDNESGKVLEKGLKSISEEKINPNFKYQNINQQAGYAAEVVKTANKNAEHIIKGEKVRATRTDDMKHQYTSDGTPIGGVNEELFDFAELDESGKYIEGTGRQLKFVGKNGKECAQKLLNKRFDKYRESNVDIAVPSDFFTDANKYFDDRIKDLESQIKSAKDSGNLELAEKHNEQLKRAKATKKLLKDSGLTKDEAVFSRLHPKLETAKNTVKIANQAGIQQAETGAVISGSVSLIKNFVACIKGDIEPKDAALSVAGDVGKGAAASYIAAFSGTLIKGSMQNASSSYVRSLSKTNLAAGMVTTASDIGKTMLKYIKGEISGAQCVEELGEQGLGELGAAMYASIALAVVDSSAPAVAKIAAGMIGSTVGYAAAAAVYKELSQSLREYELSVERRKKIEKECSEAVQLIKEYREEMNSIAETYLSSHLSVFSSSFSAMDKAILENDVDGFLLSNASIQQLLGHEVQFRSQAEFDDLMLSSENLKL